MRKKYKRVVVKVGSSSITNSSGIIKDNFNNLIKDCCHRSKDGIEVVLVSSGAIQLARSQTPEIDSKEMSDLQALSAIGQPLLMNAYQKQFKKYDIKIAQILLTHQDLGSRVRHLNTTNTLESLINKGFIPIVNENDTVSYSEITVGDNDQLAAMVASALDADLLILLTEPNGLYTGHPEKSDSKLIRTVDPDDSLRNIITKGKSNAGRGGMTSKISAVRRVTPRGIPAIIATIQCKKPLSNALGGKGTYFKAEKKQYSSRKAWLVATTKAGCCIRVDKGAAAAITKGSSLLPSGIVSCSGHFRRGDSILLKQGRKILGFGITEYSQREVDRIKGLNSNAIRDILPDSHSRVIIHRNNFVPKE